jgi:hypothetical protein
VYDREPDADAATQHQRRGLGLRVVATQDARYEGRRNDPLRLPACRQTMSGRATVCSDDFALFRDWCRGASSSHAAVMRRPQAERLGDTLIDLRDAHAPDYVPP